MFATSRPIWDANVIKQHESSECGPASRRFPDIARRRGAGDEVLAWSHMGDGSIMVSATKAKSEPGASGETSGSASSETVVSESPIDSLEAMWKTRRVRLGQFGKGASRTISPAPTAALNETTHRAFVRTELQPDAGIELGDPLGEGGSGVVFSAHQIELKRTVAVKMLRPEKQDSSDVAALLREAWIAGNLEHPNILPIHLVRTNERGDPQLVMKRIEGVSWHEVLHEPALTDVFVTGDALEWHLQVLIQTCHAVHFSHSRGILHRDLKPDNVMLGRYGEVYVVDWGLAVTMRDESPPWMPRVHDIDMIAGTPAYMAPEMAAGDVSSIDARTDVFLLGAILHEILTGERRHDGDTVQEVIESAYECLPPRYPTDIPSELATIAIRATTRDSADRYQSAAELRVALEDFLRHRSSVRQSDAASLEFSQLVAAADAGELTEQEVQTRLLSARVGFRQALQGWSGNTHARTRLEELLHWAVQRAVDGENVSRAEDYLAEIANPSPALIAQVDGLVESVAHQRERIASLERDADPNQFRKHRRKLAYISGVIWLVWNVTLGLLHREKILVLDVAEMLWALAGSMVISLGILYSVRETLMTSAVNRRGLGLLTAGIGSVLVMWTCTYAMGLSTLQTVALTSILYVNFMLATGLVVERRSLWLVPGVAGLCVLSGVWHEAAFEIAGVMGFYSAFGLAFIWRKPAKPDKRAISAARTRGDSP